MIFCKSRGKKTRKGASGRAEAAGLNQLRVEVTESSGWVCPIKGGKGGLPARKEKNPQHLRKLRELRTGTRTEMASSSNNLSPLTNSREKIGPTIEFFSLTSRGGLKSESPLSEGGTFAHRGSLTFLFVSRQISRED